MWRRMCVTAPSVYTNEVQMFTNGAWPMLLRFADEGTPRGSRTGARTLPNKFFPPGIRHFVRKRC